MNVGMVARLLYLHQKLWKTRKGKKFLNKKTNMKIKVNDIKKIQLQRTRIHHQEFCFTTNITVHKAEYLEKRLEKVLNNKGFEE